MRHMLIETHVGMSVNHWHVRMNVNKCDKLFPAYKCRSCLAAVGDRPDKQGLGWF